MISTFLAAILIATPSQTIPAPQKWLNHSYEERKAFTHRVVAIAWEQEQPQEPWNYEIHAPYLVKLADVESTFNPLAQNSRSTAFGLFQFLNKTWHGTGIKKTSDPVLQTRAAIRYIEGRYGATRNSRQLSRRAYYHQRRNGSY